MYDVSIFSPCTLTDEDIKEFLQMVITYAPDTTMYSRAPVPGYTITRSGYNNYLVISRDPQDPDYYLFHEEEVIQELGYQPQTCISISFNIDTEHMANDLMRDIVGLFASRWPCTFHNDGVGEHKRIFHQDEILRRWKNGEAYY